MHINLRSNVIINSNTTEPKPNNNVWMKRKVAEQWEPPSLSFPLPKKGDAEHKLRDTHAFPGTTRVGHRGSPLTLQPLTPLHSRPLVLLARLRSEMQSGPSSSLSPGGRVLNVLPTRSPWNATSPPRGSSVSFFFFLYIYIYLYIIILLHCFNSCRTGERDSAQQARGRLGGNQEGDPE